MHRISFAGSLLVVLAASAASARADTPELGIQGRWILGADRLSPLFSYSKDTRSDNNNASITTTTTSMSLLWSGNPQDMYDIPRLGLDYVVAPNITVGGNFFATLPMSSKQAVSDNGTTVTQDNDKVSAFGLSARAGYVMGLGPKLMLWARGGLGYAHVGTTIPNNGGNGNNDRYNSLSQFGLNLEPQFVFSPGAHVGLMAGPVLDIPLSGTYHTERTQNGTTTSTDFDASQFHFGINVGLIGWF
jgi:opacity protein-like surface antigen